MPADPNSDEERGHYWVVWIRYTSSYDGCICHVVDDRTVAATGRTLCGRERWEGNLATLKDTRGIGCLQCTRILAKRGIVS